MREPLPSGEIESESGGGAGDPLAEAIRRADLAALWRAVSDLPHQQRDALLLREFGGLSYLELAEALAVTSPAVESLLFRARQTLRERLQTAYAALNGASLADALARLFAGASSASAPVVAKAVVAAGVGAAVATGGVVVAPRVFDHHSVPAHAGARPAQRSSAAVLASAPASLPQVLAFATPVSRHGGGDAAPGDRSGSGASADERQSSGSSAGEHRQGDAAGADAPTQARTVEQSGEGGSTSGAQAPQGDSGGSGGGSPSSSGDAGSAAGGDGQPSGASAPPPALDTGGIAALVPNPPGTDGASSGDTSSDGGD